MFSNKDEYDKMYKLLDGWSNDSRQIKNAFIKFKDNLEKQKDITLNFISRPGVSYSLRAGVKKSSKTGKPLFVMVDIIDDDPENRWLSVCFYEEMITDPDDRGDFVPEGLLGEDACCFDLEEYDNAMFQYIQKRIDEAYSYFQT